MTFFMLICFVVMCYGIYLIFRILKKLGDKWPKESDIWVNILPLLRKINKLGGAPSSCYTLIRTFVMG